MSSTTSAGAAAFDIVQGTVADLRCKHPEAFITISGDFNRISLDSTLPGRDNKNLDFLHVNMQDAYKATASSEGYSMNWGGTDQV